VTLLHARMRERRSGHTVSTIERARAYDSTQLYISDTAVKIRRSRELHQAARLPMLQLRWLFGQRPAALRRRGHTALRQRATVANGLITSRLRICHDAGGCGGTAS
jgi:hypothetical protein